MIAPIPASKPATIATNPPSMSLAVAAPAIPKPADSPTAPKPIAMPPVEPAWPTPAGREYAKIGFDELASYNFEVDDTPATNVTPATDKANIQIPGAVKALDQKKVSITGFMLPLKVSNGSVTEFLIMRNQSMCCYGTAPKITEWVSVKTPEHGVKSIMDVPVSIEGTLHVGAMRENGYLIGIYQMDGDKLITPEN